MKGKYLLNFGIKLYQFRRFQNEKIKKIKIQKN